MKGGPPGNRPDRRGHPRWKRRQPIAIAMRTTAQATTKRIRVRLRSRLSSGPDALSARRRRANPRTIQASSRPR